jgi:hypothetical protein
VISLLLTIIVLSGFTAGAVIFYLLPVLVGWARHVPDIGAVVVIDVLLGWTLAGWVVALAMALRPAGPGTPVVQVVQNLQPSPLPVLRPHDAGWAGPPGPPPSRPAAAPPLVLPPRPAGPGRRSDRPGRQS